MDLNTLFHPNTTEEYMCLLWLGLGALLGILALVGLGIAALRRRTKAANTVALLVLAILGCGMVSFAAYLAAYPRMDFDKLFQLKATEDYMSLFLLALGDLLGI